jgi:hypothetical protein
MSTTLKRKASDRFGQIYARQQGSIVMRDKRVRMHAQPDRELLKRARDVLVHEPALRQQRVRHSGTRGAEDIVDVSRPVRPRRWPDALLQSLELLAVVWSIPFVIILAGTPFVLGIALLYRTGRFVWNYF